MKKLLMVDDVATNLRLVAEVLRGQYDVYSARSGEQAFDLLEEVVPDLILLDISMPKMDGYEVIDRLRSVSATADIPIIILTGDTTREAEAKALEKGAVDFIRKPFDPKVLIARIEKAISMATLRSDLELSSRKDALTACWNRLYLEEYFEKMEEGATGTLLMLDLDNFKGLNDTYGHLAGDDSLVSFANTIREKVHEEDVVVRLGGDEFIILKPGQCDRDELRLFCRELIASVELHISELLLGEALEQAVTVSIGIAQYPDDGSSFLDLYNCADKALYYVKQNGKRGYHFYQDDCKTLAEITRENSLIDMEQLKILIQENNSERGAYKVEYEGFTRIYRFVSRCVERTGQHVQVVLFSLIPKNDEADQDYIAAAMELLETNIAGLLRRADVATRFTSTQFGVILMDATKDNGMIAVNRVLDRFAETDLIKHVELQYEIQDVYKE